MRPLRRAVLVSLALAVGACLDPTLPLPPPGAPEVSNVDTDGHVTLTGVPGSAIPGDLIVAENPSVKVGKSADAQIVPSDGSYTLTLSAKIGDQISVYQDDNQNKSEPILVDIKQ